MKAPSVLPTLVLAACSVLVLAPRSARAHCDTMDGPVVVEARQALDEGDVSRVLKWVRREDEGETREAFGRALAVRGTGGAARDLADRYFFETLVRLHRAGEGEPFTGLKPAGADLTPAIRDADAAVESGSAEGLARRLSERIEHGLRERLERVLKARRGAERSLDAGRAFVAAYVEFLHYAERLEVAATAAEGHSQPGGPGHAHQEER